MLSLTTIATGIAAAFTATEDVITEVNILKPYVVQLMDAMETTYAAQTNAGQSKLSAALAGLKAVAAQLGLTWGTGLESALTSLINLAKNAFNAIADVVTAVAPGSASAVAKATTTVGNVASQASAALAGTVSQGAAS